MVSRGKLGGDPRCEEPEEKLPRGRRRGSALLGDEDSSRLQEEASVEDAVRAPVRSVDVDVDRADGDATDVELAPEGDDGGSGDAADASAVVETSANGVSTDGAEESLVRLSPADLRGGIEALLFSVAEPLAIRSLAELFGSSVHEIRAVVEDLRQIYIDEERAFRLEDIAGGVQIQTLSRFDGWIRRFHKKERDRRLSPAALETLAVIAYKQPINKADLEAIRGVGCSPILKTLLDRALVEITGREDTLGKPLLYGTTARFLETFGLQSVRDLPQPELLGKAASGDAEDESDGADPEARRLLDEDPPAVDDDDEDDGDVEVDAESTTAGLTLGGEEDEEDETLESRAEGGSGA